ncbi:MAG: EAL domain-containing protein [Campylobacterales bacterium]|nr:EAL domain-containing protein [Campylobacterales bacterium]
MEEHRPPEPIRVNGILEQLPDGMFTIDTNFIIGYANPAFCRLLGFTFDELVGSSITEHLHDLNILNVCMDSLNATGRCEDQMTTFKRKDGSVVHISKNVQALYNDDGSLQSVLVSIRDLTSLHELNKELSRSKSDLERYSNGLEALVEERTKELTHRLLHDTLTGLPNRLKLISDLKALHLPHAIILINIDSFNELNTFYGHQIGDELLCAVAATLVDLSAQWDQSSVYKLPVDEYGIVIQNFSAPSDIERFAAKLSHWISNHVFTVRDQEISLAATLGIAFSPQTSEDDLSLLIRSNMALKLAKKTRRDLLVYDHSLHIKEDYEKNLSWIKKLRSAIEEDRVAPFYQPIVNAETLKIEKYEALVRIIDEDGSVITPFHFLEISKKVKLYHRITTIMIDKVFAALRLHPDRICSINLSIEDINDLSMRTYIFDKVRECPQSRHIIFEILESEGIENYDLVNHFITEVKKHGVQIALDDFGAGYSNFAYIARLDIDYIKIDGSIIRDIHTNPISQIITETIVDFATRLGIKTVAEFVCCEEVCSYLKHLPIDAMQGYYFGAPKPSMGGTSPKVETDQRISGKG